MIIVPVADSTPTANDSTPTASTGSTSIPSKPSLSVILASSIPLSVLAILAAVLCSVSVIVVCKHYKKQRKDQDGAERAGLLQEQEEEEEEEEEEDEEENEELHRPQHIYEDVCAQDGIHIVVEKKFFRTMIEG